MFSLLRPAVVVAATLLLVPPGDLGSASGGLATAHVAGSVRTHVGSPRASKPSKPKAKPRAVAADSAPNDPLWRDSWSLTKVRAPGAWRVTKGAADVVVAVLDTGIDRSHPDLQGAFVEGWDAVNEDADANDDHGHGTLVAGVIAARSNNGIGGVGACSQCSLMPVKVIGANGAGSAADIGEGIVWAADHGARVINMSFVLTGSDDNVAAAIAYAQARGALVVAAAGTSAPRTSPTLRPTPASSASPGRIPPTSDMSGRATAAGFGLRRRAAASRPAQVGATRTSVAPRRPPHSSPVSPASCGPTLRR